MKITAADCILDDDLQGATDGVEKGNSSFHKVRALESRPSLLKEADGLR